MIKKSILITVGICIALFFTPVTLFAGDRPKEVRVAAILAAGPDDPWDERFLLAWKKMRVEKPFGLEINKPQFTEGVFGNAAEAVMRGYAMTGKYDIIWAHSAYSDQVKKLKDKFPDIMFIVSGGGNYGTGSNHYFNYARGHEAAYVMGIIAGLSTKTNRISTVAPFAADSINDIVNSFFEGAKSVNPNIKYVAGFIDSWFNPPKANQMASAQIATGFDQLLMLSHTFTTCIEKQVMCYGAFKDWHELAPDVVVTSAVLNWEPSWRWILGEWVKHKTDGTPFDGNIEAKWFPMSEGGFTLMPYYGFDSKLNDETKIQAAAALEKILSGEIVLVPNTEFPVQNP